MDILGLPETGIDTVSDIDDMSCNFCTPGVTNWLHDKLMISHRQKRTFGIRLRNENNPKTNRDDYIGKGKKNFDERSLRKKEYAHFGPSESMIYRHKIKHVLEMKKTNAHRRLLWKKKLNFINSVSPEQQVQLLSSLHGEQLTILSTCSKSLAHNITHNVLFEKIQRRIKQTQIFRNLDPIIFENLPNDYHTKNGTTIRKTVLEMMEMQIDSPETIYHSDRLDKKCDILIKLPITVLYEILEKMTPLIIYILCLWSNPFHKKLLSVVNEKSKIYQMYRMGKLYHVLALDDIEKIERIKHNYTVAELEIGIHKYAGFKYTVKAIARHWIEPPASDAARLKLLSYDNYDFSLAYVYCYHGHNDVHNLISKTIKKHPKLSFPNFSRALCDYMKLNSKLLLFDNYSRFVYLKLILPKYEYFIFSHIYLAPSLRRSLQAEVYPYECLIRTRYDDMDLDRMLSTSADMCLWRIKNRRWLSHIPDFRGRLYGISEQPQTYEDFSDAACFSRRLF